MFYRFGLIDVSDEVKEKMKQPKKRKKSGCYAQKFTAMFFAVPHPFHSFNLWLII